MNGRQLVLMWFGIFAVILITMFPPVSVTVVENVDNVAVHRSAIGYDYVFLGDVDNILFGVLLLQVMDVVAITMGLIFTFRTKKQG